MVPIEVRKLIIAAYRSGKTRSYEETAELFGVGRATVSRLLRRYRETGDVQPKPVGGNRRREVDLEWLRSHAEKHPDARLCDRIEAWARRSGRSVASSTMSKAMREIGWSHKKNSSRHRTTSR